MKATRVFVSEELTGNLLTMVKCCVAAGCSNTYSNNVSLFKFPKDPVLRRKWVKNVQRTRAQWSGPSDHSVVCSQHFDSGCFEPDSEFASQMCMHKRRRLKDDAVPTLFERSGPLMSLLSEAGPSGTHPRKRASSSSFQADAGTSKKKRTAYEKRERSRVRCCTQLRRQCSKKNLHLP